jgi:hypothetical protein
MVTVEHHRGTAARFARSASVRDAPQEVTMPAGAAPYVSPLPDLSGLDLARLRLGAEEGPLVHALLRVAAQAIGGGEDMVARFESPGEA